jgi:hypothetical protein
MPSWNLDVQLQLGFRRETPTIYTPQISSNPLTTAPLPCANGMNNFLVVGEARVQRLSHGVATEYGTTPLHLRRYTPVLRG